MNPVVNNRILIGIEESEYPYDVSILLATRGRTIPLKICVTSIVNRASMKDRIQIITSFDEDDKDSIKYYFDEVQPWLNEKGVDNKVLICKRYGYGHLNIYYNHMVQMAEGHWAMMWNDDAIMDTDGWDRIIAGYNGQFKLLSVYCNNEHPYSVFPIIPRVWYRLTNKMSNHVQVDHEISQIGYLLDIYQRIPVHVTHDRVDLTGNNNDATFNERADVDFPPEDPRSFFHDSWFNVRMRDAELLSMYMRSQGLDTTWWDKFVANELEYPFAKMADNDPNFQVNISRILRDKKLKEQQANK